MLEAARKAGVQIPTLCHHADLCTEALSASGRGKVTAPSNCRLCLVEVEGQRALQASCATPINGPMTVRTASTAIRHARRDILELMMSEHYGDCAACRRNRTCELQELCAEYGVDTERYGRPDEPLYAMADPTTSSCGT